MLFFIHYQGKEHRIRVESRFNQFFASTDDGAEVPFDINFHGNDCSILHEGKVFGGNVVGNKMDYTVWSPKGNLSFVVESEYKRIVGLLRGQDLEQENNVYAKMPGKIVKIFSKVGDVVQKGDSVIIMEAMKMENEIRSTFTGKVSNVCVKEGQAVETGSLLMELSAES